MTLELVFKNIKPGAESDLSPDPAPDLASDQAPDLAMERYVRAMLGRVGELAPYDSSCLATVEKLQNGFSVRVEVRYAGGKLAAEAYSRDSRRAVDRVEHRLVGRIGHWRSRRGMAA